MEWVGHRNLPDRPPGSGILNSLEMSQRLVGSSGEIRRELVHNFRNNCLFVPRPLAVLSQRETARRTGSATYIFWLSSESRRYSASARGRFTFRRWNHPHRPKLCDGLQSSAQKTYPGTALPRGPLAGCAYGLRTSGGPTGRETQ